MYDLIVTSLPSETGKTPHQILKEFVAEYTNSNEFDKVFDKAYNIGLEQGTEAYDKCIELILKTLNIPEAKAFAALREQGINI